MLIFLLIVYLPIRKIILPTQQANNIIHRRRSALWKFVMKDEFRIWNGSEVVHVVGVFALGGREALSRSQFPAGRVCAPDGRELLRHATAKTR